MVGSLPAKVGNMGSVPGLGRFCMSWGNGAHAPQLLSLCSRACKLQLLKPESPRVCARQQEKPLQRKAHIPQTERSPCSLQLEKAGKDQWRPSAAKNNKQNFLIKKKKKLSSRLVESYTFRWEMNHWGNLFNPFIWGMKKQRLRWVGQGISVDGNARQKTF